MEVENVISPNKSYKIRAENLPITTRKTSGLKHGSGAKEAAYYLDPNHTHFILVDDGRANQSQPEIELRLRLENKIDTLWEKCQGR